MVFNKGGKFDNFITENFPDQDSDEDFDQDSDEDSDEGNETEKKTVVMN